MGGRTTCKWVSNIMSYHKLQLRDFFQVYIPTRTSIVLGKAWNDLELVSARNVRITNRRNRSRQAFDINLILKS
jgi:hypothetical protein